MTALIVLFIASLWAGTQNALAGGGSFITLPSLILQREFPAASFGVVLGLATAMGTFTGALGPGLIGLIRDATGGYGAALAVVMLGSLVAAVIVLRVRFPEPLQQAPASH